MEWPEELGQGHTESRGQAVERVDTDVPFAAFDAAYVVSVQACSGGQLLLRDAGILAKFSDTGSDLLAKVTCHEDMVILCTL